MKTKSLYAIIGSAAALGMAAPDAISADPAKATWRGQSITEFNKEDNAVVSWRIVNDGVMGGLSEGNYDMTDGATMKFYGDLSLENNGGFSMVQSEPVDLNLSNDLGLLLRVRGDGRTYQARLQSDATFRGMSVSFAGEFTAKKGEWQQIKIPFSEFKGGWRGRDLPEEKLNPAVIKQVAILLGDKKQAPFAMEIDWIRTYGKGQGNYVERDAVSSAPETSDAPARVIEAVADDERFTILKQALDTSKISNFFGWDNKKTVFAPTDEAFGKLPEGTLEELLKPENKERLIAILSHHVSSGQVELGDALKSGSVDTVEGSPLEVAFAKGKIMVNDAALIDADILCADGVIHVVDTVLLPAGT